MCKYCATPGACHVQILATSGVHHVQILCNISCNHVQILCNIRCNHVQHAMCHAVRRDSSAVKFDKVEIAIILALFYWLTRLNNEEREENGVSGENP